ncbi:MAG: hypothetical protein JSU65_02685 [Candidatus Zixiibacteriota bacterium]|nr:MAG: hypothetical protein JSU65_02685 [candidate division Zixibacteria bacterium]
MKYELKSIGIWPLIKVAFFVNAAVGFAGGLLLAFFLVPMMAVAGAVMFQDMPFDPGELGLGYMFIAFPMLGLVFGAVFGTMFCLLFGLIYNACARLLGGLELNLSRPGAVVPGPTERPPSDFRAPAPPPPPQYQPPPPPPVAPTAPDLPKDRPPGLSADEPKPDRPGDPPSEAPPRAPES